MARLKSTDELGIFLVFEILGTLKISINHFPKKTAKKIMRNEDSPTPFRFSASVLRSQSRKHGLSILATRFVQHLCMRGNL